MQRRLHNQEKEQFIKLFKQDRVDRFEDRFKILKTFLQHEKHLSAEELCEYLSQNGDSFEPKFVIETLEKMCEYGFAQKNRFDNGLVRYEHLHLGQHHDHLICTKCRKIVEFSNQKLENLQVKIASAHGFHLLQHKMELYGICQDCLKERVDLIPLSSAKKGEKVIVKQINSGKTGRIRLLAMGLRIGDMVEIITNMNHGQVVISVDNNRLIVGRGISQKIMVTPLKQSA